MTAWAQVRWSLRRDRRADAVVLGGLVLFVLGVYAILVVAGGWLLGRTSLPGVPLAVIATAVVALAFDRVHGRLATDADRLLGTAHLAPFEVLRQFSGAASGRYASEELTGQMARVLAEGTGAAWAQVWLLAGDRLVQVAGWPAGADGVEGDDPRHSSAPGRRWLEVRHGKELLGVLVVQERSHVRLTAVEERLFVGLAAQAGLALRAAGLRTQLEQRARELEARVEELRRSRERLVDVQDDERRRIERDIHDGAQQHLVALAVNLRLAQTLAKSAPDRARTLLAQQEVAAHEALDTLVRLTRGIYPSILSDQGLVAALEAVAETSPVPVTVVGHGIDRLPPRVEAAAYFCCTEALQNVAKHAHATSVRIELRRLYDELVLCVQDDGDGFDAARAAPGRGLRNMRERVSAVDGRLAVTSSSGTRLTARIPLAGES